MKKILMSIGSVVAFATPIVVTISCDSNPKNIRNRGEEDKDPGKKKEDRDSGGNENSSSGETGNTSSDGADNSGKTDKPDDTNALDGNSGSESGDSVSTDGDSAKGEGADNGQVGTSEPGETGNTSADGADNSGKTDKPNDTNALDGDSGSGSGDPSTKIITELGLKPGAIWYGNEPEKALGSYWVYNSKEKLGQKPDTRELEALFDFVGDGEVKFDPLLGSYEEQMRLYKYARYIVTDKLPDGTLNQEEIWFCCVEEEIKLKEGATWYGSQIHEFEWGNLEVNNSVDKAGVEPDESDILALFDFVGKGSAEFDASWGTFAEQMEEYGYVDYKVKNIMAFGIIQEKDFRLYKAKQ